MTSPTPLYLICHKVRGDKAYDVAIRMECPCCDGDGGQPTGRDDCLECDGDGFWWIIPTSGHRAHPVMHYDLNELIYRTYDTLVGSSVVELPVPDLATVDDHYQVAFAPRGAAIDNRPEFLRALLRKPQVTINRRGL